MCWYGWQSRGRTLWRIGSVCSWLLNIRLLKSFICKRRNSARSTSRPRKINVHKETINRSEKVCQLTHLQDNWPRYGPVNVGSFWKNRFPSSSGYAQAAWNVVVSARGDLDHENVLERGRTRKIAAFPWLSWIVLPLIFEQTSGT